MADSPRCVRSSVWAVLVSMALLIVGCGSGTEIDEQTAQTIASSEGSDDNADATGDPATAAEADADTAAAFDSEIDDGGPMAQQLLFPGDDGYLDALGVDGVQVTRTAGSRVETTTYDRTGTAKATVSNPDSEWSDEGWRYEGELYTIEEGLSVPRMFGIGLITSLATLEVFVDRELLDLLTDGEAITDETGSPRVSHEADPTEVLAYKEADSPENWEWSSVELRAVSNNAGAVVRLEEVRSFLLKPPSNQVDPPPPRQVDESIVYEVVPIDEPIAFPATGPHPDTADILTAEVLEVAKRAQDSALTSVWFDESLDRVTPELVWDAAVLNRSPVLRFIDGFDTIDAAGTRVIGVEDAILVMQSETGTWFCIAGRAGLDEPPRSKPLEGGGLSDEIILDGSGQTAQEAADVCRAEKAAFDAANS